MALTRVASYSNTNGTTGSATRFTTTVDCGTRTSGELLVVFGGNCPRGPDTDNPVDMFDTTYKSAGTATIGTPTLIGVEGVASSYSPDAIVWYVEVTGSGTLTMTVRNATSTSSFGVSAAVIVYEESTWDTTTPITGLITGSSGAAQIANGTLTAAPTTDDETLSVVNGDEGGAHTPGSGFTELVEEAGTNYESFSVQARTGSTSTTVDYQNRANAVYTSHGLAFNVKASSGTTHSLTASGSTTTTGTAAIDLKWDLVTTTFDDDRIDLVWNAQSGAVSYDIERNAGVIVNGHGTNSYSDTGLDPEVEYTYRVRAVI